MGPVRRIIFERRVRQQNEDLILEAAREAGVSEDKIAETLALPDGWAQLIDLVIGLLPAGKLKVILTLVKEIISKL